MIMVRISRRTFSRFKVGEIVSISRKISQSDIDSFTKLSGDSNPVHSSSSHEKAVVHGAFLNALVSAAIGTKLPGPGTIVVQQTLNFPNKCYAEENVTVQVKLVELRKIITVDFVCEVEEPKKSCVAWTGQTDTKVTSSQGCFDRRSALNDFLVLVDLIS